MTDLDRTLRELMLRHAPDDGSPIGNQALRERLGRALNAEVAEDDYRRVRDALVAEGILASGRGRGGSVMRASTAFAEDIDADDEPFLSAQELPQPRQAVRSAPKTPSTPRAKPGDTTQVISYRHSDRRKNNPHVGMVDATSDGVEEENYWAYDPHIDPALNFDSARAPIENLIDDALASNDAEQMRVALEQLKRMSAPYLNWTGKAERISFEVDTVSLHVHERIDPATILAAVQKRMKNPSPSGRGAGVRASASTKAFQPDLYSAWFEKPFAYREEIEFYKHDRNWMNRLIAGDSLLVMNSLLQKESMAGGVQMIYIDPPYGIKYGSNFQPFTNKRDVKDRKDEDLTQEPEMIKAFRDTWELGIHSYLTYLRDRLLLARELLSESGSVFVQISDENVHHVREIMDEIFGMRNFVSLITFRKKTMPLGATYLEGMADYLIWYSKDKSKTKYWQLFSNQDVEGDGHWSWLDTNGARRKLTRDEIENHSFLPAKSRLGRLVSMAPPTFSPNSVFPISFRGRDCFPRGNGCWITGPDGMRRLIASNRIEAEGTSLQYLLFLDDYPLAKITNLWGETIGARDRAYVVQTSADVIERCLLMCTDPGDLVLDPTCGSGTTAFVAEKWGRRWITCDTSRVAVTLAKQRLLTASYDYYELKYPHEGLKGGFIYKSVPHVTLKSIANNPEIDEIYQRMHPAVEKALTDLNESLVGWAPPTKSVPAGGQCPPYKEWDVPFDFPTDWPESAHAHFDAFHAARQAMQKQMDASIAVHADRETLYDRPQISKTKLRITGPFTVEAVPFATVLQLDEAEQPQDATVAVARSGETSRQGQWRDELLKTGIRGKGGQILKLADLEPLPGARYIHAVGTVAEEPSPQPLSRPRERGSERVAVSFGPEHAALEQRQVEIAMREAGELFPLPKMLVFCAFTFDPEAAKDIDTIKGITALKVQMNTDLLTEDLKKARASNESFWLMGQPDVEVRKVPSPQPSPGGRGGDWYQVEVHGFDYFDTASGELKSGGKKQIALWSLDTDYDNRSLFPKQVFFPMAGAKEGWNKLKKDIRAELDEDLLEQFHGTVSLPFEAGDNRCIAVKIVDDRGIESLKIIALD
jgi:adenine-specific DNA-methyltransferase